MKKISLTLLLVTVVVLSVSVIAFTYSQALIAPQIHQDTNKLPQPTPTPSPTQPPTSTPTATPTPRTTPTPDPAAEGSFGPKGYFRIASPTSNNRYDGGNVTLVLGGEAINQPLFMAYSVDGQEKILFGAVVKQAHEWDKFFGIITASEPLPPLPSGPHTITVYGTLVDVSAQATVHFTVT